MATLQEDGLLIGEDLIPREMIPAYAIVKKAAAQASHAAGRLPDTQKNLIVQTCDEIQAGQHLDQFNMNVNELIANCCSQIAGQPLGSKTPVLGVHQKLMPVVKALRDALDAKAQAWADIVKIGRTHLQHATPFTLGQEVSGYVGMLDDTLQRLEHASTGAYPLAREEEQGPGGSA